MSDPSEAGKGSGVRPYDIHKIDDGFNRLEIECPFCESTCWRSNSGIVSCHKCGQTFTHEVEEKQ